MLFPAYVSPKPIPNPVIVAPLVVVLEANLTLTLPRYQPFAPNVPSAISNVQLGFESLCSALRFIVTSQTAVFPA